MRAPVVYRSTITGSPGCTLSPGSTSYAVMVGQFLRSLLLFGRDAVGSGHQVVHKADSRHRTDRREARIFGHALPQIHDRADVGIPRQAGIEFGLVGMTHDVHDMRSTDSWRIIKAGVHVTAIVEVLDAARRVLLHLLLGAEHDGMGRAGLGASRTLTDGNPVGAQRAFIGRVVDLGDARDVERAALDAVAAANAVLMDEIDDP